MTNTFCGLPLHPIKHSEIPLNNVVYWNKKANTASIRQFPTDTHWIDISHHNIRIIVSALLEDDVFTLSQGEVFCYMGIDELIMAFKTEEEMNMALLKYPELFVDMEIYKL